jgi:two-component system, cell cycle sensor histidine kinase and response regulator CckA
VDDNDSVRSLVCRVLKLEGYRILEAGDGKEALAISQRLQDELDLLLTDIKMPEMDGIQLAASITASHPSVGVLYISGQCDTEGIQEQVSRKGFGFLSKPFLPADLLKSVQRTVGARKSPVREINPQFKEESA